MVPVDHPRPFVHQVVIALTAICGIGLTWWLWRDAGAREQQRREVEFERLVDGRHALIRETLRGYEDCLIALRQLFTYDESINRQEFAAAVQQQLARHPGFLGLQWAPAVNAAERPAWEKAHATEIGGTIRERVRGSGDLPADRRDMYYPILFAEPLQTNRQVLGSDAAASPLRSDIEQARTSGGVVISALIDLVYESGPTEGVIMVCTVSPPPNSLGHAHTNTGVLLGVFRVAELLTQPWNRAPSRRLDVMFLDESSTLPDRRLLYCYALHTGPTPTEAQFRAGPHREIPLPIDGRKWSILYRIASDDGSANAASSPVGVLVSGLVITGLGVGYLASRLRRTTMVEREVRERTAELTDSQRKLDSFLHALPGMAYRGVYAAEFEITYISEGSIALTGYRPEEFLRGKVHLRELISSEDLMRARNTTRAAVAAGHEIEVEYRIRTRDGVEKWVLSRGRSPGTDERGLPLFEGLAIDITVQKRAEQEHLTLERRLLEGQKLESLGLLAGGIAHDFNNLLATVVGNSNLLRLELPAGAPLLRKLDAIENASQRAADLCRQMLAYAGKGSFVIEPVDLSALVGSLIPLLDVSIAARAQLRLALARDLPAVCADATQLRQIVMNLVLNAADAIGDRGGEIAITTGVSRADAALLRACPVGADLPAGDYVFLEVRDNGCGMAPEVRAKIFDPFFTTKFAGRGLGLAATLGIVRSHGGALHVETTPGTGSTFRLLLPAVVGLTVAKPTPAQPPGDWKFTGRALVIDDEEPVRIIVAGMMKSIGASVHMVGDGQSAIDAVRANPAEFDVVLLDLLMPELNGEQTLKVLRSIRADLRVLVISGYSETDVMQRLGDDHGPFKFLHKPFTRTTLIAALRELLA